MKLSELIYDLADALDEGSPPNLQRVAQHAHALATRRRMEVAGTELADALDHLAWAAERAAQARWPRSPGSLFSAKGGR